MRLEPLYTCMFAPTDSWHVSLGGGVESQGFLLVEGRTEGRLTARLRAANSPWQRADGTLTPDFRGVLETDDGATILFAWRGFGRKHDGGSHLVGSITHVSDHDRYTWLNDVLCVLTGEVRPRPGGGFDVVLDVREVIWESSGEP